MPTKHLLLFTHIHLHIHICTWKSANIYVTYITEKNLFSKKNSINKKCDSLLMTKTDFKIMKFQFVLNNLLYLTSATTNLPSYVPLKWTTTLLMIPF